MHTHTRTPIESTGAEIVEIINRQCVSVPLIF